MPRQRNRRNNNRRRPYGRNYSQHQGQHQGQDYAQGFAQGFSQGFAQGLAQHQAQHQEAEDHTRTLSAANSVPLGPGGGTRNRSAGTQVSRGVQTVSREGGNPSLLGPNGVVYPINEGRFVGCRRAGMTIMGLEAGNRGRPIEARIAPPAVEEVFGSQVEPARKVQQAQQGQMALNPARSQPVTLNDAAECAGCGSKTHQLAWCLRCNSRGLMEGCPRCNTLGHQVSDCKKIAKLSAREVIGELLYGRANMPPFNGRPWYLHFKDIQGENPPIPQAFPWSPAFAVEKRAEVTKLQAELDAHRDRSKLPVDPSTKDWETVQAMVVFKKASERRPLH